MPLTYPRKPQSYSYSLMSVLGVGCCTWDLVGESLDRKGLGNCINIKLGETSNVNQKRTENDRG